MLKSVNKVIKIMVFSDLFLSSGWGLVAPILAIYIIKDIKGGDVEVAGIAMGIYWLIKSILQIPIARYLDRNHGEKDDLYALIGGTILASLTPIGFIFATLPWHIYALQGVHALGLAMAVPSWSAIFTRHIEKGKEAFSWSLDSSSIGLSAGVAGVLGGTTAKIFGFAPLFIGVSIFGLMAAFLFFLIRKDMLPKTPKDEVYPMPKYH
jgi:DHA1 family quinolone resistance protein-like MFS transporter